MVGGLAIPFGALAVTAPEYALMGLLGLAFVALCLYDVAAGVAAFAVLAVGENVPVIADSPAIKLAGLVLLVVVIEKQRLLLLLHEQPATAAAAVFFVTWAAASSIWAADSSVALNSASRFALNVVFLFIVYGAVRERKHVEWLVWAFVSGAVAISLYGASGLTAGHIVTGVTGDPNYFASILVSALALTAFGLAAESEPRKRLLLGVAATCIGIALFLTGSRGGLVSLAVLLVAAMVFGGPARKTIATAAAVLLVVGTGYYVFFAPPDLVGHVTNFTAGGGAGRADLWKVAATAAGRQPLLGVGAANFQVVESAYAAGTINLPQVQQIVDTPNVVHNTYLSVLTELGIPGLVAFVFMAGAAVASTLKTIKITLASRDTQLEYIARGTMVALLALFTAFLFLTGEYQKYLWLFLGLAIALQAVALRSAQDRAEA
jgi:O-antigen ligase